MEITTGHGGVWFTEILANKLGRIDPGTGEITEFEVPTSDSNPFGIAAGRGGIWFAESAGDAIGYLKP